MKILIACECSGVVRRALRRAGHDAWSCDIKISEDNSPYHIHGDAIEAAYSQSWDGMIAHPECRLLAQSGQRWLNEKPGRREEMVEAVAFYNKFVHMDHIPLIAIENSKMHGEALALIDGKDWPWQIVQPWYFGAPFFKGIRLQLKGLPKLRDTNRLVPPRPGTSLHKRWSKVHREAPGPERATNRARFDPNVAAAIAAQWFL